MRKKGSKVPHQLFDALLADGKLKNDAALCRRLGVHAPHLSKMRSGKLPISDTVRVTVLRLFRGWTIRRLDELVPPAPRESMEEAAL